MRFGISVQINNGERKIYYNNTAKYVHLGDEIRFNILIENPDLKYIINWTCEKSFADLFIDKGWNAYLKIENARKKEIYCVLRDEINKKYLETLEFKFNVIRGFRSI